MPANKKYLTSSVWLKTSKTLAGLLGGYMVAMSMHLAFAAWFDHLNVIITTTFTGFLVWMSLMLIAFLVKNVWKVWLCYLILTSVFTLIIYLGKNYNSHYLL